MHAGSTNERVCAGVQCTLLLSSPKGSKQTVRNESEQLFSLLIDCAYIQDQETSPKRHIPLGWTYPFGAPFRGGSSPNGDYPLITELTKYYTN